MKIDCQYMRAEYSLFSEECAIKPAMNGNGRTGRNGSPFPFLISASSVFSVAMTTHRYQRLLDREITTRSGAGGGAAG